MLISFSDCKSNIIQAVDKIILHPFSTIALCNRLTNLQWSHQGERNSDLSIKIRHLYNNFAQ